MKLYSIEKKTQQEKKSAKKPYMVNSQKKIKWFMKVYEDTPHNLYVKICH